MTDHFTYPTDWTGIAASLKRFQETGDMVPFLQLMTERDQRLEDFLNGLGSGSTQYWRYDGVALKAANQSPETPVLNEFLVYLHGNNVVDIYDDGGAAASQFLGLSSRGDFDWGAGNDVNLNANNDINLQTSSPGRDVNLRAARDLNLGGINSASIVSQKAAPTANAGAAGLIGNLIQLNSYSFAGNGEFVVPKSAFITDATPTTLAAFDVSGTTSFGANQAFGVIAYVSAVRSGGASGTGAVGDGLYGIVSAAFKGGPSAGALAQIGTTDVLVLHKDASFPATPLTFAISGNVIQLQVTGEAAATIFWQGTLHVVGGG